MSDYKQVEQVVNVPLSTGVTGFLAAIKAILELSRVTDIHINSRGAVRYNRWVRDEDDANANLRLDLESITPIAVVRNNDVIDVGISGPLFAAKVLLKLLVRIDRDQLYPVCFVIGANSVFLEWLAADGVELSSQATTVFSVPLIRDRFFEDDVLVVCAAYGKNAALVDTRVSYKLALPAREAPIRFAGVGDENLRADGKGRSGEPREAVRAPEMGSPGARSGNIATLPLPDLSGRDPSSYGPGPGGAGPGRRT